jgi:hypothetical protein
MESFWPWLEQNKFMIGLTGLIISGFVLLWIYVLWPLIRGNKAAVDMLANTNFATYPKVTNLGPLGCPTNNNTTLCDYYIASSSYTVFPGSTPYDFISDGIIPLAVKAGARLIELDVYAGDNDKPVVGLKNEALGYDYAKNAVDFEACCIAIANTAFNSVETNVSSDPFVLSLMFHTDKRTVMDAAAEILKNTCQRYLLGPEYAYNKRGTSLAQEPICKLAGKLIVVSGGNIKGTNIEELVNLSWSTSNLRRLTYMQAAQPYDHDELINSNRTTICMVVPDPVPDLKNSNPTILFAYGCQWNMMNYGSLDNMMELYIGQFQQASVILKPEELRYRPVEAKKAVLPDPATHSFQPMATSSPIYDSNPVTGDKSIVV